MCVCDEGSNIAHTAHAPLPKQHTPPPYLQVVVVRAERPAALERQPLRPQLVRHKLAAQQHVAVQQQQPLLLDGGRRRVEPVDERAGLVVRRVPVLERLVVGVLAVCVLLLGGVVVALFVLV